MKKVDIKTLNDNFIEAIGKEWMLIASGNRDHFNVMTASWGCVGWLWNKPVAVIFVRPERFTHDFIEDNAVVLSRKRSRYAQHIQSLRFKVRS